MTTDSSTSSEAISGESADGASAEVDPLSNEPPSSGARSTGPDVGPSKPARKRATPKARKPVGRKAESSKKLENPVGAPAKFPRHDLGKSLRIPRAILDQNAGHPCTPAEAAKFLKVSTSGAFNVEISSSKKYGLLESREGKLAVTDRAKRIIRPQSPSDELEALRDAVLQAPEISDVYNHYRGESLPDDVFFTNTLTDTFKMPADKVNEFREIFLESIRLVKLTDESGDRIKLIDVGKEGGAQPTKVTAVVAPGRSSAKSAIESTCFVMQPFIAPYGTYYDAIFRPAIEKASLVPVRADTEIFSTGKIMDQILRGIRAADVLLAELTTKNANVYYELGIAHALGKPVVLIAANESDVPFDLRHIRVIYYDMTDPFWGSKLIDKISDNIISAINNPEEAIFRTEDA
ncbi:MAG: hypothetical protein JWO52_2790 [Gammaproteobacteria bacterium]|nr:hypothetical protein [Gammaproteobacteria bacterium]